MALIGNLKAFDDFESVVKNFKNENPSLKAILFDMDGTILNSEPLHAFAIYQVLPEINFPINYEDKEIKNEEELQDFFCGQSDASLFTFFKNVLGNKWSETEDSFIHKKNLLLEHSLTKEQLEESFAPEIKNILTKLKDDGFKLGLVSASQKSIVDNFSETLNFSQWFEFMMGAEDTEKTKPDPMPYIEGMDRFKVGPQETLIFEDSETGLESALSSEAYVYKVEWYKD